MIHDSLVIILSENVTGADVFLVIGVFFEMAALFWISVLMK